MKLTEGKGTGMEVKDTYFSVSNCDTLALTKRRQQNHPTVARIEVTQPLELVCTDLSGPKHIQQAIAMWTHSLTTTRP